jgi:Erv1 / Alr family
MKPLPPDAWGSHYWFFLMTIAYIYPDRPNPVTKRKYYDFIQNVPLFIPNDEISKLFSSLLNKYPVTPYLVKRESLLKWVHFIHNKINVRIGKPKMPFYEAMEKFENQFRPKKVVYMESLGITKDILFAVVLLILVLIAYICI